MNLPVTPITDLMVHNGNLIASTMGRAYWILDDMQVLRQFPGGDIPNKLELLTPSNAYRVSGSSALDAIKDEDDDDAPATSSAGTNPATGVSIYYVVPDKPDSIKLTLNVLDDKGVLVRSYSTRPDKKFIKFPGGPNEDPLLPNKPGLNRFVWDLRYATLPGVNGDSIEGSYKGRRVSPGEYTLVLKHETEEMKCSFKVIPDPRIKATLAEYEDQEKTLAVVDGKIKEIHDDVNQMREIRKQINELAGLLTDTLKYKAAIDSGKSLIKKLTTWEEKLVQPKAKSNDDIINFVNKLTADYIFLKGEMDVNIPGVTKGQRDRLAELNAIWAPFKTEYTDLQKLVEDYNSFCRNSGIEKITIPEIKN